MTGQRPFDRLRLAADARRIQAGAGTGQPRGGQIQQGAGDGGGAGGVADAHFAADEQMGAADRGPLGGVMAGGQRVVQLRDGHGRLVDEVGGAGSHPSIQHAGQLFQRLHGADVDHFESRLPFLGQDADGRAAARKIADHLGGDHLRKSGNALGRDPVIAGEHGDPDILHSWPLRPLHGRQGDAERFQATQRTGRFGQLRLSLAGGGQRGEVGTGDGIFVPAIAHAGQSLRVRGRPAMTKLTRSQRPATD